MDIRTQAALLAAIVSLALASAALLRDNRTRVFTLFALFCADLFLFSLSVFFLRWAETFGTVWWERLAVGSGALVPAAALAFFLEFLCGFDAHLGRRRGIDDSSTAAFGRLWANVAARLHAKSDRAQVRREMLNELDAFVRAEMPGEDRVFGEQLLRHVGKISPRSAEGRAAKNKVKVAAGDGMRGV